MDWFSMAWNRAADFNGRSRRKEYWMFTLLNTLICIVLLIPSIAFARIWIGTHCDHSTFTISKIAFWSFGNRWKVQSVLPSDISRAWYGVVQRGRGGRAHGIRTDVRGKSRKVFAGIVASEAKRILQGLNRMGVHVLIS
jgi:hypothetical protein